MNVGETYSNTNKPIPMCPMGRKKEDPGYGEVDYSQMLFSSLLESFAPPPKPKGLRRIFYEARRGVSWLFGWSARRRDKIRRKRMKALAQRISTLFTETMSTMREDSADAFFDPEAYKQEWFSSFEAAGFRAPDPRKAPDTEVFIGKCGEDSVIGGKKPDYEDCLENPSLPEYWAVMVNSRKARIRSLLGKEVLSAEEQDELKLLTEQVGDVLLLD